MDISGVKVVSSNRGLLLMSEEVVSGDVVSTSVGPVVVITAAVEVSTDGVVVSISDVVGTASVEVLVVSIRIVVSTSVGPVVVITSDVEVSTDSVLAASTLSVVSLGREVVSVDISGVVSVVVVLVESAHSGKSQLTLSDSLPPRHFPSGPGSTRLVLILCPLPQVAEQRDQSLQSDHLHLEVVGSIAVTFFTLSSRQSFPSSANFSFGGHVQR